MVLGLDYPPQTGLFPFFNSHMNSNNEGSEMENLGQLGKKPELFEVYLDRDTTVQFDKQRVRLSAHIAGISLTPH